MAVFKATLPFTMAALLMMTNQAILQRNSIMQKLPKFDKNVFGPCKNLEEYQRTVIRNRYCTLHILNTLNMLKRLYNPSTTEPSKPDQDMTPSMSRNIFESKSKEEAIGMNHADMPEKHLIMVRARPEMEAPQKIGRRSQANFEQYQDQEQDQDVDRDQDQDQDQNQDQDQDQNQDQDQEQEYERKKVEEKQGREEGMVTWRKKMLRRMG